MAQPITPQTVVYGFTLAGDPQVSPDGSRVLYTLSKFDQETKKANSQLWLRAIDGSDARRLTWNGERNSGGRWSPDGSRVAFVSDRVAKAGIFVLNVDHPGEAREVTHHAQAITDLAWSPDGSRIAYTTAVDPANPDETPRPEGAAPPVRITRRIDYKQDGQGYLGDTRRQVFVVDVASGERRKITSDPVDHNFPQWSPDGTTLAVQVPNRNGMCSQLELIDVEAGTTRRVGPEQGVVGVWSWSPSGDRIIYGGDTENTHQLDFFVLDVASGAVRRLTNDLQVAPVGGMPGMQAPSQPVWLDDRQVLFHAARGGASGLHVIDAESGTLEPVHSWDAQNAGLSVDRAGRYVVQGQTSLASHGEISVYDAQTRTASVITSHSAPVLAESPAAQAERIEVQRGEFTIEAWLLKPADFDPSKRYPVILDVHGGPNGFYGPGFNAMQQILATNGFLLVFSNPRGSTSYGRHFTQQVTLDWGGEDFKDLMAVVDKILERPYADAERTGIIGYSYGGYMTAWTIGQTDRFKAAVCGAPCFDLESMYGTSDISHTFGELQWGGAPHQRPDWYHDHSPSTYAHRAVTPTLIVHGEADQRCPIGQGEQMFVALQKAGCEVEFARYPGGSHGFTRLGPPEHREDYWTRSLAWFKDHLGEPA
ncbi:MAG TPA: S9 family peptidase [Thermomicrobiaceae bacterium]|nr:S9 family peptidase [Thermomicrobiaceae bacterium]